MDKFCKLVGRCTYFYNKKVLKKILKSSIFNFWSIRFKSSAVKNVNIKVIFAKATKKSIFVAFLSFLVLIYSYTDSILELFIKLKNLIRFWGYEIN